MGKLFKLSIITLILMFGVGCRTLIGIGEVACDAVLGGSSAGDLCSELDNLKADEVPAEAPAEAPVE